MGIRAIVLSGGVLVAFMAILRHLLSMAVLAIAGILVMAEGHALPRDDGRRALGRYDQGQKCESKNADDPSHLPALYAVF